MPAELSEHDRGFNAGIDAAIAFHELRAVAADKAHAALPHVEDDTEPVRKLALQCIGVMRLHRHIGNALRGLKKITDAELAERDRVADVLNR